MSTTVVVNGLNYFIPAVGDNNWGQNVTDALVALATAASSNASVYNRVTVTSSPITVVSGRTYLVDTSSARTLNLPSPANNAYLFIKDTTGGAASNNITVHRFASESIDGVASDKTLNLNRGFWGYVSDGTNWFSVTPPWPVPYSFLNLTGSILNADLAGSIAYSKLTLTGAILNADLAGSIAVNKLVALSTSKAVATDGSGFLVAATTTATELGYLSGVTSAIQTQIAAKLALAGGTLTGVITASIDSNIDVITITDSNGQKQFIEKFTGATSGGLLIATNRDPVNGTFAQTGQTASSIELQSASASGSCVIKSSNTNNTAPSTVASFSASGCALQGTTTNDSATAGNVGEFVDSSVSSLTTIGSSGQFANVTSISLTSGDWEVSGNVVFSLGTGTGITNGSMAISAFTGNTTTDHVAGKNAYGASSYPTSTQDASIGTVPRWRVSIASTTTIFLKGSLTYSGGAPKFYGYISATRRR